MSTERLYYTAAAPIEFDALVERVEPRDGRTAVWLDRTGFYPTSGGQPHDFGTIDGIPVLDVVDDDEGGVMHLLASPAPFAPAARVHGIVDWSRRFDHMQQHTGQHVLSAVLERMFSARTVSFHLGTESSTVDLDRELTASQLAAAELEANRAVWENSPVIVRYVSAEEARRLPLRKEPARAGTLRLIEIERLDLSACGGTHVDHTGAIGQIALGSWERFKGGLRVEFLCGSRALMRHQLLREAIAGSIRLLSVLPHELPAGIERLQAELKDQRKALAAMQGALARHEASAFADAAVAVGDVRAVLREIDGDANRLKTLASAIVARPGVVVVLVSASTPALAVAARSADVDLSCQAVVAALTAQFGGRGGGKADLAQCGGLQGTPEAVLDAARAAIASGR